MKSRASVRRPNRRARGVSARDHLLDVQIRTSTARRRRNEKVGRWIFNILLVVIIGTASYFGLRTALDKFFYQNSDYTLQRITLELDNVLTRDEALAETGLQEGVNIFSVDLAKMEATLLKIPQVESVHIERQLPDHILVRLTSRLPIAWIAAEGETGDATASPNSYLVDSMGFLMRVRHVQPEYLHLPVIYGVKSDNVQAGEPLHSEDLRMALQLIDTITRHPESLLRPRTIDISKGYCIEVVNDRNARIIFAAGDFEEQLSRLQQLLTYCDQSSRVLETVNLMVKHNTPVTFVVAEAPVVTPTKSLAPGAKTRRN